MEMVIKLHAVTYYQSAPCLLKIFCASRVDNQLLRSLSHQPPQSCFCSAASVKTLNFNHAYFGVVLVASCSDTKECYQVDSVEVGSCLRKA